MGETNNKLIYIYTLSEPETNEVRYVGKTVQKPMYRYSKHISSSKLNQKKDYTHCWIKSLLDRNLKPKFEIIEETYDINREVYWISYYRKINNKMTNFTNGGEIGNLGKRWKISPEKLKCLPLKHNTPILQYDRFGNFIKKWNVARDFAKHYNMSKSSPSSCLHHKCLCAGYIIIRESETLDVSIYNPSKKPIKILDKINNKTYIFNSACEAARKLNLNNSSISKAVLNNKILHKQFKIEYL